MECWSAFFIHFLLRAGQMERAEMNPADIYFPLPLKQWPLRKQSASIHKPAQVQVSNISISAPLHKYSFIKKTRNF
jgi:hypothetical protein